MGIPRNRCRRAKTILNFSTFMLEADAFVAES